MTHTDDQCSPWADADLPLKCLAWVEAVDRIMKRDWYIDTSDAGADREDILRYWGFGDSPDEFVEWFAAKHGLIRFD